MQYLGKGSVGIAIPNDEIIESYLGGGWELADGAKPEGEYTLIDGIWVKANTPLENAISDKITEIQEYCDTQDHNSFEYPLGSDVYYKVTDAVMSTINQATLLGLDDSDPIPVPSNDNCWDDVTGTVSTPFTVGDLKALYMYGYAIPESNYNNTKTHITNVSQLTTIEEVSEYDFTTGWI